MPSEISRPSFAAPTGVTTAASVIRGARIPHASLGRAAPPAIFTAEAREMFLYAYTPQAGETVFDIGAGIGAETLLFSRLVGRFGCVVSFEAHPRTYERLARLCEVN